jgi:hypothetical protein
MATEFPTLGQHCAHIECGQLGKFVWNFLGTSTVCPTPQNLHNFLNFQSIFEQTGN